VEAVSRCQGEQLEKAAGFLEAPLALPDAPRPNRYPEATEQPDTYSPKPTTRYLSRGQLLPGCRSLRARRPLASPRIAR
jgi:hypothetical protein